MKLRSLTPLALAVLAAMAGAACRNDATGGAAFRMKIDSLAPFALSGTPLTAPAAVNIEGASRDTLLDLYADPSLVRVDSLFDFDLAFDIDQAGRPVVLTPRAVGGQLAVRLVPSGLSFAQVGPRRVGIRAYGQGTSFDALTRAPNDGWKYDSLYTPAIGEVMAVETFADICQGSITRTLYAKVVVDSVRNTATERKLFVRVGVNRNCGYRSFLPGIPRD